ncbi:MAG: thioredoxin-disulfide reductase [Alphaproteobacteria bacterium]|nr:MAG: thioredoxin-disulfide reductase [Alphaproteobacteria bacterium]
METKQVIIIGSGPAGYTAALYTSRAGLNPIIIEGHEPGGQLTTTTDVENFPGFPEGVMGPDLMTNMRNQVKRFGTEFISTKVTDVDLSKRPFHVKCENGQEFLAETLIISTGASAKYLGLANEMQLIGKGVSACATCDGFFYRNKIVHVVGGGDTALEEANFLTRFAEKVILLHRKDAFRASKPMQERTFNNPKIEVIFNTEVKEILFDQSGVNGLKVFNNKTQEMSNRKTDGFFLGIGHEPNTKFLKGQLALDDHGYIKTQGHHPDTSVSGVFACGDVQDPYYRQAISAAGSGCQAAIRAERFLEDAHDKK